MVHNSQLKPIDQSIQSHFWQQLSCVWVTTDRVWIGNWIYWIITDHTLRFLSLLYIHRLSPGNGFQRCSFLSFRVHVLTGQRLSHNSFPGWWVLEPSPLRLTKRDCFFSWSLTVIVLIKHPLSQEDGVVSYEFAWPLSSVHITHITCYWKFFLLYYIHVLCQYRLCEADHAILLILRYNKSFSHLNSRKLDHRQV
jgi:hypothetical protein